MSIVSEAIEVLLDEKDQEIQVLRQAIRGYFECLWKKDRISDTEMRQATEHLLRLVEDDTWPKKY